MGRIGIFGLSVATVAGLCLLLSNALRDSVVPSAQAAGGQVTGPNTVAPERYVYYPGTEVLAEDEVRVIACGTGMPDQRRGQASACFVFEFGNGEKLIFDIGSGSMRNINALMIPAEYLTKVFISHLHTDHWADLNALWAGGWTAGRPVPLEVWGPSGQTKEMGTAYAIDGFLRAFNWDYQTRAFKITPAPGNITKDGVKERMAVSPDRASAVPGPTRQPPPERGRPDPMSDFIKAGEWGPGFNAQNEMLDEHMKKFNLQDQDWRRSKPWYKPKK